MSARKSHPPRNGTFAPRAVEDDIEPTRVGTAPRTSDATRLTPEKEVGGSRDESATYASSQIRLDVIAGPDAGKSRRFRGVRMVVGRASECDFRVSDGSVSRRHLELVLSDECVLLRDLGTGNGTRVNGQRVGERVLRDQDQIAIGRTRFRFVDEGAAIRRARELELKETALRAAPDILPGTITAAGAATAPFPARPRDRRTVIIGAALLLVAIGVAIGFAVRPPRPELPAPPEAAPVPLDRARDEVGPALPPSPPAAVPTRPAKSDKQKTPASAPRRKE
jgi:predicted component of type VI protein secretion system